MKKRHFWFYKYCFTCMLKLFTADIRDPPTIFTCVQNSQNFSNGNYTIFLVLQLVRSWAERCHFVYLYNDIHTFMSWAIHFTFLIGVKVFWWIYDFNVCKEQWWAPNIHYNQVIILLRLWKLVDSFIHLGKNICILEL